MSPALLLALASAGCAAAALADLLDAPRRARALTPGTFDARRTAREAARAAGLLGRMTVLLAQLARRAGVRGEAGDLEARIAAAGTPLGLSAADVVALKRASAVAALLAAAPVSGLLPGRLAILAALAAPVAGFLSPEIALRRAIRARSRRIAIELADVLDLLRVAVAAGLPVGRAMGEVGRRMSGTLAGEIDAAAARMQLGVPRAEALATLAARCPAAGVATLAAAIARADRHGAPLAPTLEALAAQARAEQARMLRDSAARAAPKIQLVVALVLVPAVMLLVAAALLHGVGGQASEAAAGMRKF